MLLSAIEPGQEMAIANFTLAICCLFTISLPLLLVTRGDKTKSNRDFIAATVNPWSLTHKDIKLSPVIISDNTPTIEVQQKSEVISQNNDETILDTVKVVSIDTDDSDEQEKSSEQVLSTKDELLAA